LPFGSLDKSQAMVWLTGNCTARDFSSKTECS
jgi:hypothetical protein